jgi:hypothetical protein
MPLQKLQFRPGLNREGTDYSNEGGWYDGDKVRFRSGFPEKIGGWTQFSSSQFDGIARSIWIWLNADAGVGNLYTGVGTSSKYYIYSSGIYNDVTPIIFTSTLTNPFATTNTLTSVTVTDANYNPSVGDYVIFTGTYTVGGVTISGEYIVVSVPSSTTYTITAATPATSTTTGGGSVTVEYEYPSGSNLYTVGTGWGSGPWSRGTWGSAYSVNLKQQLRLWSNDNFGADLVIAPRGGPIFYWQDANGVTTRAQYLSTLANSTTLITDASTFSSGATSITVSSANAPYIYPYMIITGTGIPAGTSVSNTYITGATTVPLTFTLPATATTANSSGNYNFSYAGAYVPTATYQVITSAIQEFVIAFGSNSYDPTNANTDFNPLLVRWSDQANPYQWIPTIINQSGEYTLTNGSFIMGARATRQEILIWTDSAIYSMQYLGAPYVWGFQILMDNITIMSPNSMVTVNNVTYWMGKDRFYMYSGRVEVLPCALRQYIFADINQNQSYQVFAGANEAFNEVWWFYCSIDGNGGSETNPNTLIDKYVIYNYLDRVWYYGTMARTAWMQSGTQQYPIAADYNGRLLNHENGCDDQSTSSTQPIDAYVQSSDFDIGDGHNFGFVWRILPDVNFNGSTTNNPTVTMTVKPRQNSGTPYGQADNPQVISAQNYTTIPEYTIQQFTGQVYTRLRGRQMAFRIESTGLGVAWQLGSPRIDIRPDGRR